MMEGTLGALKGAFDAKGDPKTSVYPYDKNVLPQPQVNYQHDRLSLSW